jgi:hypothetical protein
MFRVLVRKHVSEAIVRPPFEFLDHGDKLAVRNGTRDEIVVTVPDVFKPFELNRTPSGGIIVAPGKTLKLTIRNDAELGVYSYSIFCKETNTYAQANSDPEFIIE